MHILESIGNTSGSAAQGRSTRLRRRLREARVGKPHRQRQGPHGAGRDLAGGAGRSAEARDTVVEYTGGSTGASLALVCAARGYGVRIVSSDAFSREKLDHMAALGARLTLVPSEGGLTTRKLIQDMIETARSLSREPHTYWTDQLNNHDSIAGYYSLGEEIWSQARGEVDAFVHCAGTAASSRGVATVLKRHKPTVKIVVVEPAESSVLSGRPAGASQDRRRRDRIDFRRSGSRPSSTRSCR